MIWSRPNVNNRWVSEISHAIRSRPDEFVGCLFVEEVHGKMPIPFEERKHNTTMLFHKTL